MINAFLPNYQLDEISVTSKRGIEHPNAVIFRKTHHWRSSMGNTDREGDTYDRKGIINCCSIIDIKDIADNEQKTNNKQMNQLRMVCPKIKSITLFWFYLGILWCYLFSLNQEIPHNVFFFLSHAKCQHQFTNEIATSAPIFRFCRRGRRFIRFAADTTNMYEMCAYSVDQIFEIQNRASCTI